MKATTEGVVRPPSAFVMMVGFPPSIAATAEFVVPRSMPTTCNSARAWHTWRLMSNAHVVEASSAPGSTRSLEAPSAHPDAVQEVLRWAHEYVLPSRSECSSPGETLLREPCG